MRHLQIHNNNNLSENNYNKPKSSRTSNTFEQIANCKTMNTNHEDVGGLVLFVIVLSIVGVIHIVDLFFGFLVSVDPLPFLAIFGDEDEDDPWHHPSTFLYRIKGWKYLHFEKMTLVQKEISPDKINNIFSTWKRSFSSLKIKNLQFKKLS